MDVRNLAYGLIFDNLLGLGVAETRRLTNLYALLYSGLVVSDSWMLTNASLQFILSARGGDLLLREGIIVVARRTSAASLTEFLEQANKKQMHGVVATTDFTQHVDALGAPVLDFDLKAVASAYKDMADRVIRRDFLISLGLSEQGADTAKRLKTEAEMAGVDTGTNTFVKDGICPALSQSDAAIIMEAARAPYGLNLPNLLGTGIIGPEGFQGDRILAALRGQTVQTGSIDLGSNGLWSTMIRDPMASWLLNEELGRLTVEELVIARSTSRRDEYLRALRMFMQVPTSGNWQTLEARFDGYLRQAGHDVFQSRQKKADPRSSEIALEGKGGTLCIVPNIAQPVRLNPLGGESGGVRVVGRTYDRGMMPPPGVNAKGRVPGVGSQASASPGGEVKRSSPSRRGRTSSSWWSDFVPREEDSDCLVTARLRMAA